MDGRNVGGSSNSGGSGRPKLVRPGISLQREGPASFGSGTGNSGHGAQTNIYRQEGNVAGMQKPHISSSLNPNISTTSDSALSGSSLSASLSSVQKSFASKDPNKDIMSKAGAEDKANLDVAKKSSLETVSTEGPAKLLATAMPEGLSSLVSYSSSSAEASASEDNGQDDQDDLSTSAAPEKLGDFSDQSSEALVKRIEDIASLEESLEGGESIGHILSKGTLDQVEIPGNVELSRQPEENMTPTILDAKTGNMVMESEERSNSSTEIESQQREEKTVMKPTVTEAVGSLVMSKEEHEKESRLSKQDRQSGKVDASLDGPKKDGPGRLERGKIQGLSSYHERMSHEAKPSSSFGEKEIPGNQMKTQDAKRRSNTDVQDVGLQPSYKDFGPQMEGLSRVSSGPSLDRGAERAPANIRTSSILSKALLRGMPSLPSKETAQESSGSASLFGSTEDTKDLMQSLALDKTSHSARLTDVLQLPSPKEEVPPSPVMEMDAEPTIKESGLLEDQSILSFDPIEEQLKLLTEGHLGDLGSPDDEGGLSPSDMLVENILASATVEQMPKDEVEVAAESKEESILKPTPEPFVQPEPPTIFGGEKKERKAIREEDILLLKKDDEAEVVKEVEAQSSALSVSEKETPMDVQDAEKLTISMPAVEGSVCESLSNSSTSEEGKVAEVIAPPAAEELKENVDVTVKKRSHSDDASVESTCQEQEEPKEKRIKLEEKDVASAPSADQGKGQMLVVPKTEIEEMEVDTKTAPTEDLPPFEKLSEDFAASQKLSAEEESKNGLDDSSRVSSPFKDISEGKEKEEEKEEESTPSSKRKRKKKSYERPRGEGGKFRKERPGKIDPSLLDEDTRMEGTLPLDEDSQGSVSKREVRRFRCEVIVPESTEVFTADKVVEYVWPLEGCGEHYFIQEQISQYLGIMSFKRKYPDLRRRPLEMQERDFLKDKGLVSEMACDLGLTAVRSEDVLDVMLSDFPMKFEELQRLLRERKENEMKERGKVNYSMATLDKSKMQEYLVKAAEDSARWNAVFNREKREERRYSFDLQTCTLQMPRGRHKKLPPEMTKMGAYPVAVLPGQFTDYYRQYTPGALKSMPLNTVMAAPTTDSLGSDGAGSESEEDASVALPAAAEVPETVEPKDEKSEGLPRCKVCCGTKNRNKGGKPEPLIICGNCRSASHPTCIDLTLVMVPKIESYNWQCMDCKSCVTCNDPDDEDKMIFCDMCDRGYHIYCVGLRRVPNGRWHCKECAICSSCGSKTPAGSENAKNAEWQHEFKKDKNNKQLRYATTLCVPCDKYWKRRQFCYVCLKVYRSIPEDGMVRCSNCPKYIHREGCSTMYENERFCNNCYKIRNSTALNHSRIIAAAKKKMASGY